MIILFQIILFLDVYNAEWSSKPISSYQVTIVLGLSSCLPDNISYDMSKFLIYLWKAKWSPVDFTWPVSVNLNAGIWLTLSTDRLNFVITTCPKNLLWNFKIDIRTFGKTNFEYCIGMSIFYKNWFLPIVDDWSKLVHSCDLFRS